MRTKNNNNRIISHLQKKIEENSEFCMVYSTFSLAVCECVCVIHRVSRIRHKWGSQNRISINYSAIWNQFDGKINLSESWEKGWGRKCMANIHLIEKKPNQIKTKRNEKKNWETKLVFTLVAGDWQNKNNAMIEKWV